MKRQTVCHPAIHHPHINSQGCRNPQLQIPPRVAITRSPLLLRQASVAWVQAWVGMGAGTGAGMGAGMGEYHTGPFLSQGAAWGEAKALPWGVLPRHRHPSGACAHHNWQPCMHQCKRRGQQGLKPGGQETQEPGGCQCPDAQAEPHERVGASPPTCAVHLCTERPARWCQVAVFAAQDPQEELEANPSCEHAASAKSRDQLRWCGGTWRTVAHLCIRCTGTSRHVESLQQAAMLRQHCLENPSAQQVVGC